MIDPKQQNAIEAAKIMSQVIAILISDLHLSHQAPVARSAEPDWYAAMARPLDQVRELAKKYSCPVICAGDVFDKWNATPELINWAIDHLPRMIAIPGQHDLPLHRYEDMKKSAYWTLIMAGSIMDASCLMSQIGSLQIYGWAWGCEVEPQLHPIKDTMSIAVAHAYVWQRGQEYAGAPQAGHLSNFKDKLKGYAAAVFGDNHQGFLARCGSTNVLNCGCLIRRKSDERKLRPAAGLLFDDGHIEQHFLDTTEDKWLETEEIIERIEAPGMEEFLEGLNQLESDSLDFREAVQRYVQDNPVSEQVKQILLEVL